MEVLAGDPIQILDRFQMMDKKRILGVEYYHHGGPKMKRRETGVMALVQFRIYLATEKIMGGQCFIMANLGNFVMGTIEI